MFCLRVANRSNDWVGTKCVIADCSLSRKSGPLFSTSVRFSNLKHIKSRFLFPTGRICAALFSDIHLLRHQLCTVQPAAVCTYFIQFVKRGAIAARGFPALKSEGPIQRARDDVFIELA